MEETEVETVTVIQIERLKLKLINVRKVYKLQFKSCFLEMYS